MVLTPQSFNSRQILPIFTTPMRRPQPAGAGKEDFITDFLEDNKRNNHPWSQLPTYFAYTARAVVTSSVPEMMARASGKIVSS